MTGTQNGRQNYSSELRLATKKDGEMNGKWRRKTSSPTTSSFLTFEFMTPCSLVHNSNTIIIAAAN